MDFSSGSGSHSFISFRLGEEVSGQPTQENPEDMERNPSLSTPQITVKEVQSSADLGAAVEHSSASDSESCGAYFTRKMESLGAVEVFPYETKGEPCAQGKASVCDPVSITPGLNLLPQETEITEISPQVTFLVNSGPSSGTLGVTNSDAGQMAESGSECIGTDTASVRRGQMDYRSHTDDDYRFDMKLDHKPGPH